MIYGKDGGASALGAEVGAYDGCGVAEGVAAGYAQGVRARGASVDYVGRDAAVDRGASA